MIKERTIIVQTLIVLGVERPAQGAFYDNHALVSLGYWRVIWDE